MRWMCAGDFVFHQYKRKSLRHQSSWSWALLVQFETSQGQCGMPSWRKYLELLHGYLEILITSLLPTQTLADDLQMGYSELNTMIRLQKRSPSNGCLAKLHICYIYNIQNDANIAAQWFPLGSLSILIFRSWHVCWFIQGTFCACTQPMRDDVTFQRRLSLAGRIHIMVPVHAVLHDKNRQNTYARH